MPINRNVYQVNWDRLIIWNIPGILRNAKMFNWLKCLMRPLVTLHGSFLAYNDDVDFRIVTNGQVCRLRGALNARFDSTLKRITITKGGAEKLYVFTHIENQPQYLTRYLGMGGGNFIVNVPTALNIYDEAIRLLIDAYKRPTKTYTVNYV